jgi:redox-sensitive bicupin YhaK (pirin superfamily)
MSAIRHLIRPQARDIGFPVRRLLPSGKARTVGPFVFLDHMGPAHFASTGTEGDVRPHPHIGLATVTYLFSGAMLHRDSLGHVQRIEPGSVNWMSAGRGIVHSERIPEDVRAAGTAVEGIQMWVALPQALEESEPDFTHYQAESMPMYKAPGVAAHVLVGNAFGLSSPVRTPSPTLYAALTLKADARLELPVDVEERAIYLLDGAVELDGQVLEANTLAVLEPGAPAELLARADTRMMLLGGAPLDGERFIWWNFVASTRERIEAAKTAWREDHFTPVPGEHERIPLPD